MTEKRRRISSCACLHQNRSECQGIFFQCQGKVREFCYYGAKTFSLIYVMNMTPRFTQEYLFDNIWFVQITTEKFREVQMLVSKKCREFFCIIMCCNLAFPTTVDVISIISNNNRCYFQQQLMSFPTSVDVISNNSQCHFQQQSMSFPSFPTAIDAISNDSRCHFKQQSMSFPTTVDVISNNSRYHFQQQSMSFPITVDVISNNS